MHVFQEVISHDETHPLIKHLLDSYQWTRMVE